MKKALAACILCAVAACGTSEDLGDPDGGDDAEAAEPGSDAGLALTFTGGSWFCDQDTQWSYTAPVVQTRRYKSEADEFELVDNHDGTLTVASAGYPDCVGTYAVSGRTATLVSPYACRRANDQQDISLETQTSTVMLTSMTTSVGRFSSTFSGTQMLVIDGQVQNVAVAGSLVGSTECTLR